MSPEIQRNDSRRVAYILKRYPRLSETFIVNEILGLEGAGTPVRIFAGAHPREEGVHEMVGQVRAAVTYTGRTGKAETWDLLAAHHRTASASPARYEKVFLGVEKNGDPDTLAEFVQAGRIAACCLREEISHLHAHFATFAARVACLVSRLTGIPFSFTAHAKDIFLHTVDRSVLSDLLRRAEFVVAISEYHRKFLLSLQPGARVEIVRNGIHLSRFPFRNGRRSLDSPIQLLAAGRLVEKKGFADLIRACALLRDRAVPFQCRIVGEGEQRPNLEQLIAELRLQEYCRLEGAKTQEELIEFLGRASVFVTPCVTTPSGDRDGLPTVLLEAMTSGVPVIATPVTAIPEIVRDGRTGHLVPEKDPKAIAGAIERIRNEPESTGRMVEAARRIIQERHDSRQNSARLADLFREEKRCLSA